MNSPYESFLLIFRDGKIEFYRNGLPIAYADEKETVLHQFKDANGQPLPPTLEHLNGLVLTAAKAQAAAGNLEMAAVALGRYSTPPTGGAL